jgi:hypothetical protein
VRRMKDSNMTPIRNVGAEKKLVALLEQDFADGPMNAAQAATGHWPAESTHKEKQAKPLTLRAGNPQHKHTVKTKIRNRDELCRTGLAWETRTQHRTQAAGVHTKRRK